MDDTYKIIFGHGSCVLVGTLQQQVSDKVLRRYISIKLAPLFLEVDFGNIEVLKYANTIAEENQKHIVYEVQAEQKEDKVKVFALVSVHRCVGTSLDGWKVNAHTNFVPIPFGFVSRESIFPATSLFKDADVELVCGC